MARISKHSAALCGGRDEVTDVSLRAGLNVLVVKVNKKIPAFRMAALVNSTPDVGKERTDCVLPIALQPSSAAETATSPNGRGR